MSYMEIVGTDGRACHLVVPYEHIASMRLTEAPTNQAKPFRIIAHMANSDRDWCKDFSNVDDAKEEIDMFLEWLNGGED